MTAGDVKSVWARRVRPPKDRGVLTVLVGPDPF